MEGAIAETRGEFLLLGSHHDDPNEVERVKHPFSSAVNQLQEARAQLANARVLLDDPRLEVHLPELSSVDYNHAMPSSSMYRVEELHRDLTYKVRAVLTRVT